MCPQSLVSLLFAARRGYTMSCAYRIFIGDLGVPMRWLASLLTEERAQTPCRCLDVSHKMGAPIAS